MYKMFTIPFLATLYHAFFLDRGGGQLQGGIILLYGVVSTHLANPS